MIVAVMAVIYAIASLAGLVIMIRHFIDASKRLKNQEREVEQLQEWADCEKEEKEERRRLDEENKTIESKNYIMQYIEPQINKLYEQSENREEFCKKSFEELRKVERCITPKFRRYLDDCIAKRYYSTNKDGD